MNAATRSPGDWTQRLRVDPTVFIAPGAVVVGDVEIGPRAGVWFNTVVRGDTAPVSVGAESNLQDNSVVHVDEGYPARIGARVTVGHRAIVHGCVIEDDCLIGMGSIVLTGARIGAGSLIGAGALILEGQQIPPGSTVLGTPAKVVGAVRPEHREAILHGAEHYVALAANYRARGLGRSIPGEAAMAGESRGPITELERSLLLGVLEESPRWAEVRASRHPQSRWLSRPAADRWSAHEIACHLRDNDREVFGPRLGRLLTETAPAFEFFAADDEARAAVWRRESPADALREWSQLRAALMTRIAGLGTADWGRIGTHGVHGPYGMTEMVRAWVEHDLAHRRQMVRALGEPV